MKIKKLTWRTYQGYKVNEANLGPLTFEIIMGDCEYMCTIYFRRTEYDISRHPSLESAQKRAQEWFNSFCHDFLEEEQV